MNRRKYYRKGKSPIKFLLTCSACAAAVVAAFFIVIWLSGGSGDSSSSEMSESEASDSSVTDEISSADSSNMLPSSNVAPEITSELIMNSSAKLPDAAKQLLISYTEDKYKSLGALEFSSLSEYFDSSDTYGKMYSYFCDTSLEYLIYVRQNRTADLTFKTASFTITVNEVSSLYGVYTVDYEISESVDFTCTDATSYSCGMEAEAKIIRTSDGEFKLTQMAEDTDVNLLIEEQAMDYLGFDYDEYYLKDMTIPDDVNYSSMFKGIKEELIALADKNIAEQQSMLEQFNASPSDFAYDETADNEYDRDAAVAYAYKWVGKDEVVRNPDYADYSMYGGNCQNYTSQCIHSGGVPMDNSGNSDSQWKWYNDEINTDESPRGRSTSWSGTENFYIYCNENTGSGLVAVTDGNIFSAQPGDVMQYVVDGWAHHSVIVSKVLYDESGNVVDILINSNTTDRVDFPLSAYGYTDIRLIHIIGWNE